jgi:hypothetical protein
VYEYVLRGSEVFTDALSSYKGLKADFNHDVVDHAETYVNGKVHTNGLENFWCLLKRAIKETYVSRRALPSFPLPRRTKLRFNERKSTDAERFLKAIPAIIGKHLT